MKPKIIYRYVAGKFWLPFFFSMAIFCILVLLGDFFENIKDITNGYATLRLILKYCFLNLPGWLGMLLPVACLLGSLFVISDMIAGGEWTACLASGYRPRQLFAPLVICVLFVLLCNGLLQEYALPKINIKAEETYYKKLRGKTDFKQGVKKDVTLRLSEYEMMFAQKIETDSSVMQGITLDTYNKQWEIQTQITAEKMTWDGGRWILKNGYKRDFDDGINIKETVFDSMPSPLKISPANISVGETDENTTIRELLKKISFLGRSGLVTYKEKTDLHNKLATPVMTVLMCLLGMPFATTMRKKGKVINIIAALVMSFSFWWVMTMAATAGKSGLLSPWAAGWGVVIVCFTAVLIQFKLMKI
ncbi:MAG: LptF/LptG family permease [Elusimicrobium sp.]|jgi:lipopolysaccharide export system permease protein|nr:LptF/LptG family permease [Elusimicrobium sp.]